MAELEHGPLTAEMVPLLTAGKSVLRGPDGQVFTLYGFGEPSGLLHANEHDAYSPALLTYLGEDIGDGWIAAPPGGWTENPAKGARVEARCRDGAVLRDLSDVMWWHHTSHPDDQHADIIAFRLSNTPKHEATDAMGMSNANAQNPLSGKSGELKHGDLHTLMMDLIREDIQRQRPDAFTEDNDFDLVIPTGCTPSSAYAIINVSDLAEAILPHVRATTQPAEQSASSPVEGEVIAAARELLDACYTADANSDLSDFIDGSLLTRLDKALTTRSVAVSSEAVGRVIHSREFPGQTWEDTTEAYRVHVTETGSAILSLLNQARKPEGEPFGYVYQCVGEDKWQLYRTQLRHADGTIASGKPVYAHPAHEAGEVERALAVVAEALSSHPEVMLVERDDPTAELSLSSVVDTIRAALEDKS